ncbi:MAG: HAD hydrolase-like protein [Coriobacteriales bacterium]|nr:HAD hydrolase-like protein [Coriobacteriales bacterium]
MCDIHERRVVLFDFDGTLANTKDAIIQTATRALLRHGIARDELGDVSRLIGPPFPQAFSQVYGLSAEEADAVTSDYRSMYATLGLEAWPLFDGIAQLLQDLRSQGKTVCVATSKLQSVLDRALADEGIRDVLHLAQGKPSDKPFTKEQTIALVLAHAGATADEAVMVGDRHHDVEGAAACGVPCVGVTYGGTGDYAELSAAGACRVVDTVGQLAEVLLGKGN